MKRFLLSILFFSALVGSTNAQIQNYAVGSVVDDFTVTDTEGHEHNLTEYTEAGKYVYLDFFFYNCGPCQTTAYLFNEFHEKYGCNSGDIICITINGIGEDNATVDLFEANFGGESSPSPGVGSEGGSAAVSAAFGPAQYPTYCLVGPGNILLNGDIWGPFNVEALEAALPDDYTPTPAACIVNVENDVYNNNVKLYPNPVRSSSQINIDLDSKVSADVSLSIIDLLGKEYQLTTTHLNEGSNTVSLPTNGLATGVYFVKIKTADSSELFSFEVLN